MRAALIIIIFAVSGIIFFQRSNQIQLNSEAVKTEQVLERNATNTSIQYQNQNVASSFGVDSNQTVQVGYFILKIIVLPVIGLVLIMAGLIGLNVMRKLS